VDTPSLTDAADNGPLWLLAGPTASGKTEAALALARDHDVVIINADSMQVYRDLSIITARPDTKQMRAAPHALFGSVDAAVRYSTGAWLSDALRQIREAWGASQVPLLVGGTGLYFQSLTRGLAPIPAVSHAAVEEARSLLESKGIEALLARAEALDPDAAGALQGSDTQRALRIVAVATGTGTPLSQWQRQTQPPLPRARMCTAILAPDRSELYARINRRCETMLCDEGVGEVQALLARQLPADLPAMRAIGVSEIRGMLQGIATNEEALDAMAQATRNYAKRQLTFLRNQFAGWPRLAPGDEIRDRFGLTR
jgi:tRNA dimethylallyltransferase